jgi:hypothetical protein
LPIVSSLSADSAFQKRSIAHAIEIRALTTDGILLDRATGEQAASHILRELRAVPQFALLFVDASGVRVSSFAALKATFAIFTAVRPPEFTTRDMLVGVGAEQFELMEALDSVARSERIVIPAIDSLGAWRPFGYLTPAEQSTLNLLMEAGTLTSAQLHVRLQLTMSAASNRLRLLHTHWMVRRIEQPYAQGGREFVYARLEI